MSKPTYRIDVTREGRWWIVYAPDIDYHTQSHSLTEAEDMGRDLIASALDIDPDSFALDLHVEQPADVAAQLAAATIADDAARQQSALAARDRRAAVTRLHRDYGLSVLDTARLLGISRGRVYQLLNEDDSPLLQAA
jgi:DNA-directed RNA polymerase specialized sigma24 family protein